VNSFVVEAGGNAIKAFKEAISVLLFRSMHLKPILAFFK
jgi:hypothetical protein